MHRDGTGPRARGGRPDPCHMILADPTENQAAELAVRAYGVDPRYP